MDPVFQSQARIPIHVYDPQRHVATFPLVSSRWARSLDGHSPDSRQFLPQHSESLGAMRGAVQA